MRLAVVQLASGLDKPTNLTRAERGVRQAAEEGAEVVILPEATMADFGSRTDSLSQLAESLDGPFTTTLGQVASDLGVTVVAGMFERGPEPGKVFNTVVAVSAAGVLGHYRKVHLFDALGWRESDRLMAGEAAADALLVLEVGGIHLGVLTCFDLRFPEIARLLAERGATAIAVPAAWVAGPGKVAQWQVLLRARAIENTLYVAGAGQPGPRYAGHSSVVDPTGVVLAQLDGEVEGPAWADLSSGAVEEVRQVLPLLANRRFGIEARPDPS